MSDRPVSLNPSAIAKLKKRIAGMVASLDLFLCPYLPFFGRYESRETADQFIKGLLSGLPRKSAEPMAELFGKERKTFQRFLGAAPWDDVPIRETMMRDIALNLGHPDGVLNVDPTTFPKQGKKSVGVARQWCGRLGKNENCQSGAFLGYASPKGSTLIATRLYLPEVWAKSRIRRKAARIPKEIVFQKKWEIIDDLLCQNSALFPHAWTTSDAEFGRCGPWRDRLRARHEKYLLEIPCSLNIRPKDHGWFSAKPVKIAEWLSGLIESDWETFNVRDTAKGPLYLKAVKTGVATLDEDGEWRHEVLLVTQTLVRKPELKYFFVSSDEPLSVLVKVACRRHSIEECFQRGKSDVGMGDYEVRSWVGWNHHMTLAMLAMWFLEKERISRRTALFPPHGVAPGVCHDGTSPKPSAKSDDNSRASISKDETLCGCLLIPQKKCSNSKGGKVPSESLVNSCS
jgi:SRSO17 transposase